MPEIPQSAIFFLKTRDLEANQRFYSGVLGLPLALDQGACRIYRIRAGAFVGFCLADGEPFHETPPVILTLVVEDVDAFCAEVARAGVAIDVPPRENPKFQIYQCFFRDPDGYTIEVQRFLDPRWGEDHG